MKYPKEYLEEIKSRLKVSSVVIKSVNLKKRGKEFVGLSPFKNEKTPSFTVNDEKGFYHCFSTGEHGNIFDFLMKTQNLKFGEAVKTLASLAGIQPYTFSKIDEEREKNRQDYTSIYSKYVEHYHQQLINNQNSKIALEYLNNRKISLEQIKKFKIGYVDKNPNFFDFLLKDFEEKKIIDSGLFYLDEKNKKKIERFRERIIFPINSISGKPIALGGRTIQAKNYLAKYINSPETPFFRKGSNLYNLDFVRKFSNKTNNVFLVEGYMDVIGLSNNGIENAVANLGTSLTEKQILILNQFFEHVIICFDGDESGYKAALRAAESAIKELQPEKKISFLFLPDKEDPDSFSNKKGKEYFINFAKDNSIAIHKFIFSHYKNETDNNPSSLAVFEKKLKLISSTIKDEFIKKYVKEYFLEKVSNLTPYSNTKKYKFYNKKIKSLETTKKHINETNSLSQVELKEFSFLYLLLNYPELFQENIQFINNVKIFTKENKLVFNEVLEKLKSEKKFAIKDLTIDNQLIDRIFKFASIKHIVGNKKSDEKIFDLMEEIIRDLKNYELEFRIEELESKFSKDLSESTFNEIKELKKMQKIN